VRARPREKATPPGVLFGDYAVNTIQPRLQPYSPTSALSQRLPMLHTPNIGDELTAKGARWAWYSGRWDNAGGITTGPGWTNGITHGTCLHRPQPQPGRHLPPTAPASCSGITTSRSTSTPATRMARRAGRTCRTRRPFRHQAAVGTLYRFRTHCGCCDLRFGRMGWLRQDRDLCPFVCSTSS
jgi:hypothetical protein